MKLLLLLHFACLKIGNAQIKEHLYKPRNAFTHVLRPRFVSAHIEFHGGETLVKTVYSENYKPIRHEDVDRAITDKGNGSA